MAITVRDMESAGGDDNSFTTLAGDNAIAVMVAASGDDALGTVTWDGQAVTEVIEASSGGGSSDKRVWIGYLLNPNIGTLVLANGDGGSEHQSIVFIQGGFLEVGQVRVSNSEVHTSNDLENVALAGLTIGDLCVYVAGKQGGGGWTTTEDENDDTGNFGGAYEVATSTTESATFGEALADSRIAIAGVGFKVASPTSSFAGVIG